MLRSAYEAITNSRFGVFNQKERTKQGTLRSLPRDATHLRAGWVEKRQDGSIRLRVVKRFRPWDQGDRKIVEIPHLPIEEGKRFAAVVVNGIDTTDRLAVARALDKTVAFAWLELMDQGGYLYWKVVDSSLGTERGSDIAPKGKAHPDRVRTQMLVHVKGIIHWTDSDFPRPDKKNTDRIIHKRYERFVPMRIVEPGDQQNEDAEALRQETEREVRERNKKSVVLGWLTEADIQSEIEQTINLKSSGALRARGSELPADLVVSAPADFDGQEENAAALLKVVIDSYKKDSPSDHHPGTYVEDKVAWALVPGTTEKPGDPGAGGRTFYCRLRGKAIVQMSPALIGRGTYEAKPWDLLGSDHHPAPTIEQLSPADRVFGWVASNKQPVAKTASWKGLLTVDPPEFYSGRVFSFDKTGLELGTLGEPKVSQARFYSASRSFKPEGDGREKSRDLGFGHASRLRGRKVYLPHVQYLGLEAYWNQSGSSGKPPAYRRWNETKPKVDTNLLDAVSINSQFRTALRFQQLTAHELGALVWLLSLPWEEADAQTGAEPKKAVLSLGLGKPYGFGSVSVEPDWEATRIDTADDERDRYCACGDTGPETASLVNTCFEAFDQVLDAAVREDFLDAVCGYTTGKDSGPLVHYPMTADQYAAWQRPKDHHEKGLFLWWVENDRGGANVPRKSLPTLGGPPPTLTRHPERQGRQQGRRHG